MRRPHILIASLFVDLHLPTARQLSDSRALLSVYTRLFPPWAVKMHYPSRVRLLVALLYLAAVAAGQTLEGRITCELLLLHQGQNRF